MFTYVLAQSYQKHGLTMSHSKAHDNFMEEFEVPVLDREELQRENDEMKPQVATMETEVNNLRA